MYVPTERLYTTAFLYQRSLINQRAPASPPNIARLPALCRLGAGAGIGLGVVAARRRLSGLSALVPGRRRRRRRRPARHRFAAPTPRLARRRRGLAVAGVPVADDRFRLRRVRLLRHRPVVRDHGGLRRAARARPRPRPQADPRLRAQPQLRPPSLVRGEPDPHRRARRLVPVARPRPRRRPAQQLAVAFRRPRLDLGRRPPPVLLPLLPAHAARSELARTRPPPRDGRRAALLAEPAAWTGSAST